VKPSRFYYLAPDARQRVDEVLERFAQRAPIGDLWEALCRELPVDRQAATSLQARVEGMSYAAEYLWNAALQAGAQVYGGDFDRQQLRHSVQDVMPITHYHYKVGSRLPKAILVTRRDALEDPGTALAKLKQDIEGLVDFIRRLPEPPAAPPRESGA